MRSPPHLVLLVLSLALPACAFTNPANTPLLRTVEEHLVPDEGPGRFLMLPLALPIGLLDVVICHPIQVIDDSYRDTRAAIWDDPSGGLATRSYFFLPKAAATPVVHVGSWLGRSLFDIPPHLPEGEEAERVRLQTRLEALEKQRESALERRDALVQQIDELHREIEEVRRQLAELEDA